MDMDAMVMDSHQLMMSEEQRHHLFKVSRFPVCCCVDQKVLVVKGHVTPQEEQSRICVV